MKRIVFLLAIALATAFLVSIATPARAQVRPNSLGIVVGEIVTSETRDRGCVITIEIGYGVALSPALAPYEVTAGQLTASLAFPVNDCLALSGQTRRFTFAQILGVLKVTSMSFQ